MDLFKLLSPLYMNKKTTYEDEYYLFNHVNRLNSFYGFFIKPYYRYLASYILTKPTKIKKGAKILDIGCGVGILTQQLNQIGFDTNGVDVNPSAIKHSLYPSKCKLVKT
ncbi:class I SAM-dependent methyltransferase, partial [Candidatus Beckwithbacteria bacterium]|nr:class I SAM-dependent methyltransferase [Candidatus Beckwithbacteria bacterium]